MQCNDNSRTLDFILCRRFRISTIRPYITVKHTNPNITEFVKIVETDLLAEFEPSLSHIPLLRFETGPTVVTMFSIFFRPGCFL